MERTEIERTERERKREREREQFKWKYIFGDYPLHQRFLDL